MSFMAPCDRHHADRFDHRGTGALNINAGIDSSGLTDPAHRGTLASPELAQIHQTTSFKKYSQLEQEDRLEAAAKLKLLNKTDEVKKSEQ